MALPVTRIALDGEAVAHCPQGLPDFHALLGRAGCARACLYGFDLLWREAKDVRGLALIERRALLREHLKNAGPAIIDSEHLKAKDGEGMFRHACRMGLEGIVSKRVDSRYRSGRCAAWVKVKNPAYERRGLSVSLTSDNGSMATPRPLVPFSARGDQAKLEGAAGPAPLRERSTPT